MSGEELGVNTHRVFSLFKWWVIIDLTPTLMLEKVGSGEEKEEEEEEEEREAVWDIPLFFSISSVFNTGFQALANSPLASNFLLLSSLNGFLAKSDLLRVSLDPLCFSTSTLRALRVEVAILPLDPSSAKLSFSLSLFESFTGLSFFNPWVGSKEEDVSIPITIQGRSVDQGIDRYICFLCVFHRISSFNGSWWSLITMIPRIRNNKAEGVLDWKTSIDWTI